jgi:hypothetical protein
MTSMTSMTFKIWKEKLFSTEFLFIGNFFFHFLNWTDHLPVPLRNFMPTAFASLRSAEKN